MTLLVEFVGYSLALFFNVYIMWLEWCYQGEDHDEFIARHNKSLEEREEMNREKTLKELGDLLGKNNVIAKIIKDEKSKRAS